MLKSKLRIVANLAGPEPEISSGHLQGLRPSRWILGISYILIFHLGGFRASIPVSRLANTI